MEQKLFYLINNFYGDGSPAYWKSRNNGCTSDLNEAHRYTSEEVIELQKQYTVNAIPCDLLTGLVKYYDASEILKEATQIDFPLGFKVVKWGGNYCVKRVYGGKDQYWGGVQSGWVDAYSIDERWVGATVNEAAVLVAALIKDADRETAREAAASLIVRAIGAAVETEREYNKRAANKDYVKIYDEELDKLAAKLKEAIDGAA